MIADQFQEAIEAEPVPDWFKKKYVKERMAEILPNVTKHTTIARLSTAIHSRMLERWCSCEIDDPELFRQAINDELRKYVDCVPTAINNRISAGSIAAFLEKHDVTTPSVVVGKTDSMRTRLGTRIKQLCEAHPDFALQSMVPESLVLDLQAEIEEAAQEILMASEGLPKMLDGKWRLATFIPDDVIQSVIETVIEREGFGESVTPENVRGYLIHEKARDIGDDKILSAVEHLLSHANSMPDDNQPAGRTWRMRAKKGHTDGG
ncbi:MAG: hypothetical protein QF741_00150 [Candidatus Peribacteraceae bacterium]|jgi:hypothetical protein|nr:hypothetical protein [Candidatus Peribacteraceae bacterium]MDP7454158.1 hypothetical protein [Candidatus Peribacteraceae bacterium]MDP7646238.1 hypothetical protein [Candidatus Peribacteraceae bacterium]